MEVASVFPDNSTPAERAPRNSSQPIFTSKPAKHLAGRSFACKVNAGFTVLRSPYPDNQQPVGFDGAAADATGPDMAAIPFPPVLPPSERFVDDFTPFHHPECICG